MHRLLSSSAKPQTELARKIDRYHRKSDQADSFQFGQGKPSGAEKGSAVVDEQKLYPCDQQHDSRKRRVFCKMGEQIDPMGAGIEAVEDA